MMQFLGLVYGISAVLTLLLGLSGVRAAVEYRAVGRGRARLLRRAGLVLGLTAAWSVATLGLLTLSPWSLGEPFSLPFEHGVLALLPVAVGWFPGLLLLVLGAGPTDGTRATVPAWARWMDGLWTE